VSLYVCMYVWYGRAAAALDEGRHKDRREGGRESKLAVEVEVEVEVEERSESRNILE